MEFPLEGGCLGHLVDEFFEERVDSSGCTGRGGGRTRNPSPVSTHQQIHVLHDVKMRCTVALIYDGEVLPHTQRLDYLRYPPDKGLAPLEGVKSLRPLVSVYVCMV